MNISGLSSQISSAIFSKIDTKNQGYVDKSTFASAIGDSSNSSSDDAFKALDTDSDGKLTKSELTKGVENLLSQLNSASTQSKGDANRPLPPDGNPPPPPPEGDQKDTGLTKDEVTKMATETKDTKLSSLLKDVASNFDSADTDKDGKVTRDEAMAYEDSKSTSSTSASSESGSTSKSADDALKKVAELLAKYVSDSIDSTDSSASKSNISVSA